MRNFTSACSVTALSAVVLLGCGSDPKTAAAIENKGGQGITAGADGSNAGASGGSVNAAAGSSGARASGGSTASGSAGAYTQVDDGTFNQSYDCPPAAGPTGATPALTVGTWVDITPRQAIVGDTADQIVLANCIGIDPCEPTTIYTCTSGFIKTGAGGVAPGGVWKSTDGGSTWTKKGEGVIDSPAGMAVGPNHHLFVTDGVRGNAAGFWRSDNGGDTWAMPKAFKAAAQDPGVGTQDVSSLMTEPKNFKHVLVGFHGGWTDHGTYLDRAGIFETPDGGNTWYVHPPLQGWNVGSPGISFLFDPVRNTGDAKTWLFAMDGSGFWRTTNSGATWKKVSTANAGHGGNNIFYSGAGVLYAGAEPQLQRSTDNGETWSAITQGVPTAYYFTLTGDGTNLYAIPDANGTSAIVSPDADGTKWTQASTQRFARGAFKMDYDATNHIVYAANWEAGLWALKVK